jgi:hypothetical protein
VSELPNERTGAQAEPAKGNAWASVSEAQALWAGAMRAHEQAPPILGSAVGCRRCSSAAAAMRDSHARALESGLAWPVADSGRSRAPYELRPGTGRRGPTSFGRGSMRQCSGSTTPARATTCQTSSTPTARSPMPPRSWPTHWRLTASDGEPCRGLGVVPPAGSQRQLTPRVDVRARTRVRGRCADRGHAGRAAGRGARVANPLAHECWPGAGPGRRGQP